MMDDKWKILLRKSRAEVIGSWFAPFKILEHPLCEFCNSKKAVNLLDVWICNDCFTRFRGTNIIKKHREKREELRK